MPLRNKSNRPTSVVADCSPTGTPGAPLSLVDDRPPTSLELVRQLEELVRELFEIRGRM
jgi:hypothetical protein